jgi:hypothetical protein
VQTMLRSASLADGVGYDVAAGADPAELPIVGQLFISFFNQLI